MAVDIISAMTPPGLFGIDRRIAYANLYSLLIISWYIIALLILYLSNNILKVGGN
jgi:hypothetical protein